MNVLGVGVSALNRITAAELVLQALRERRRGYICVTGVHGFRDYLYGGANGVAQELGRKLSDRYPGLQIVGAYEPPVRPVKGRGSKAEDVGEPGP